ncbi:hypothetical protein JCM24511_03877 [Saitozyma sp. JCM 24511]|nr:hypothetical protein JCM24511_03877 [Saitozyma sp. JCM 24511]
MRREASSNRGGTPPADLERILEALICTAQHSRDVSSRSEKVNLRQQALEWNHCPSCGTGNYKGTYAWSVYPVVSRCKLGHLTDITDPIGMTRLKEGRRQLPDEITGFDLAMTLIKAHPPAAMTCCPHTGCGQSSAGVQVGWEGVKGHDTETATSIFGHQMEAIN